jgi:serine/threonine protein phosphatase PrpC
MNIFNFSNNASINMGSAKQAKVEACVSRCDAYIVQPRNTGEKSKEFFGTQFQSLLDMQKGKGSSTKVACSTLATEILKKGNAVPDQNRRLAHLTALLELCADTAICSKKGDSLASFEILSPAQIQDLDAYIKAARADVERGKTEIPKTVSRPIVGLETRSSGRSSLRPVTYMTMPNVVKSLETMVAPAKNSGVTDVNPKTMSDLIDVFDKQGLSSGGVALKSWIGMMGLSADSLEEVHFDGGMRHHPLFDSFLTAFNEIKEGEKKPVANGNVANNAVSPKPISRVYPHEMVPTRSETLHDVGVVSCPSAKHPDQNHDRASVFMWGDTRVTIVCDGVSDCGSGVTGEAAAAMLSTKMEAACKGEILIFGALSSLIDYETKNPGLLAGELNATDASVAKLNKTLSATLNLLRSGLTTILNDIRQDIDPKTSATTFEMSFELPVGDKKFLIACSVGDSQTLVYNRDTKEIKQLNAGMYSAPCLLSEAYSQGDNIYFQKDLRAGFRSFKPVSDPGGIISGERTVVAESIAVTVSALMPGDVVITASDGLTDNFSILQNGDETKIDQVALSDFINATLTAGLSDENLAQRLVQASYDKRVKPDDITVCVHTVAFQA